MRCSLETLLLVGILAVLSVSHVYHFFDYPVQSADSSRDYLVAHYIVAHHEFPLAGPWNDVFGQLKNSPAYYYLIALFLLIKDHFLFFILVNILLHLASLLLVYWIGRLLFAQNVGILATIMFGFSAEGFKQASYPLMPHLMQPFLLAACLLLILSLQKKKPVLLFISIGMGVLAGALHNSAFSVMPLFFLAALFVARSLRGGWKYYAAVFGVAAISLAILYIPVFIYFTSVSLDWWNVVTHGNSYWPDGIYIHDASSFINNFAKNIQNFLRNALPSIPQHPFAIIPQIQLGNLLLAYLALASAIAVFSRSFWRDKRFLLLAVFILQPLLLASLLKIPVRNDYFTPVLALGTIFFAGIALRVLPRRRFYLFIPGGLAILYAGSFLLHFHSQWAETRFLANGDRLQAVVAAIREKARVIRESERFTDYRFFQLRYIQDGPGTEALIGGPLERDMGMRLFSVDDRAANSLRPVTDDLYLFLTCNHFPPSAGKLSRETCIRTFESIHRNYRIIETVSLEDPFSVYLAKREDPQ